MSYSFLLLLILAGLTSCESEEFISNARGDAFVVAKIVEGDTVFGLMLHAVGNSSFSSVVVTPNNDHSEFYQLKSYFGSSYEYYYEPEENNYSSELLFAGDYEFTATFQSGDVDTSTDILTDEIIYPPVITLSEFASSISQINLEWEPNDDVDYYVIAILDEDGDLSFVSESQSGDISNFQIYPLSDGWISGATPINGGLLNIELAAYMYETGKTGVNIQAKSIANTTVVWE